MIHGHYIRLSPSGLAFKRCNVLAPYLLRDFNIMDCHWTIIYLVAVNHPLVVLSWSIDECGVEIPSNLRTLDLSRCETFFVIGDGVNKSELLIPWVEVMQTTLMNSELNVWFPFRLSIDDEHHIVTPVGDEVLETQISQRYNIGDGIFTEPHTVVLAIHRWLVGHCHHDAIALKLHFRFWLRGLLR